MELKGQQQPAQRGEESALSRADKGISPREDENSLALVIFLYDFKLISPILFVASLK